jgi:hypothetical protein
MTLKEEVIHKTASRAGEEKYWNQVKKLERGQ